MHPGDTQPRRLPAPVRSAARASAARRAARAPRFPARRILPALLILVGLAPGAASAGTLRVRVRDARTGLPVAGAFVQVGAIPGVPFAGNGGRTAADGRIDFTDPALAGPQTVTAAAAGFARLSVLEAVTDSVTLALHPEVAGSGITGPKAQVSGVVQNIATTSNDGNLDIGIVYPAVRLSDLVSQRSAPIEVPADTVNFPIVGQTILPGNVVVPTQTEAFILQFSKPTYHFFVPSPATYDFVCVAGRVPLTSLSNPDILNLLVMREVGVERQTVVSGNRTLNINSDLDLTRNLTITMPEAAAGATMQAFNLADLAEPDGVKTLFYDSKSGTAGAVASLLLSGKNPSGDLATAQHYLFGQYADSSAADAWGAGRIDRAALTLPATRTIGQFFNLPALTQDDNVFRWSDVARPGVTPAATWGVGTFRLGPITPGDAAVVTRTAWEVWAPAGALQFVLPALPDSVGGGLPDPAGTATADELQWEQVLIDAAGGTQQVLDDAYATVTRFSRRRIAVALPVAGVADGRGPAGEAPLALTAPRPNPFSGSTTVGYRLAQPGPLRAEVYDVQGRLVRALRDDATPAPAGAGSLSWDGRDAAGARAARGLYFIRLRSGALSAARRVMLE